MAALITVIDTFSAPEIRVSVSHHYKMAIADDGLSAGYDPEDLAASPDHNEDLSYEVYLVVEPLRAI